MWRVSYAIITAVILFMLLWRIFGLRETAHFRNRSKGTSALLTFADLAGLGAKSLWNRVHALRRSEEATHISDVLHRSHYGFMGCLGGSCFGIHPHILPRVMSCAGKIVSFNNRKMHVLLGYFSSRIFASSVTWFVNGALTPS